MQNEIRIITEDASGELTEKRSRFIAQLHPIHSEEEAISYIENIRKQYYDARHNCYAYIVGENASIQRFSDDGEPSGTAGRPILDVLLANHLTDCVLIVTRYFGGILLGAGPLARAYGQSAALAVADAKENGLIGTLLVGQKLIVQCDYNYLGKLQYLFLQNDITPLSILYEETVTFTLPVENSKLSSLKEKIKEATAASAKTEDGGGIRFIKQGQKILLY
ncbi:MAG: YigZ family protein [Lachnospiraceae bacterium]|nr:YigZ family protein [Lachnospiraceae bacterium]